MGLYNDAQSYQVCLKFFPQRPELRQLPLVNLTVCPPRIYCKGKKYACDNCGCLNGNTLPRHVLSFGYSEITV